MARNMLGIVILMSIGVSSCSVGPARMSTAIEGNSSEIPEETSVFGDGTVTSMRSQTASPSSASIVTPLPQTLPSNNLTMILTRAETSEGHGQLLIDPATGATKELSSSLTAYGWSPSGNKMLFADHEGGLYVADAYGNNPRAVHGLPGNRGIANAWWLTEDTAIVERGSPSFEIGIAYLDGSGYKVMPRKVGHARYVQSVSPLGNWWLEYDESAGELETAYPDGSTRQFIQGMSFLVPAPAFARLEPQFAVTSNSLYVYFPSCHIDYNSSPPLVPCELLGGALQQGHAGNVDHIMRLPEGLGTTTTRLSPDDRYLYIADIQGERYLVFDLRERTLTAQVPWQGLGSTPDILASPISDQFVSFESQYPYTVLFNIDAMSGLTKEIARIMATLTPVEWHVVRP